MEEVYKFGQMALAMKVSGKRTKLMVKESSGMWMAMSLMENGRMTKLMAMESTLT